MVCTKCEKKLGTLIHAEMRKANDGQSSSSSASASGAKGRGAGNTLLSKKNKNKFAPYETRCKLCKTRVHQEGSHYCQNCSYKNGICAMCGVKILDTKLYKQTAK
ncbi:microtubule-associated protein CRIPT-domain-containing protein [Obelidium mucronatum]|nr:microtubule-associated protein CRIPT-domain-containing protein [Obelidium mucronatum]